MQCAVINYAPLITTYSVAIMNGLQVCNRLQKAFVFQQSANKFVIVLLLYKVEKINFLNKSFPPEREQPTNAPRVTRL